MKISLNKVNWGRRIFIVYASLSLASFSGSFTSLYAEDSYGIDENGHLEWTYGGQPLMTSEGAAISSVDFEDPDWNRIAGDVTVLSTEAMENGFRLLYSWGSMTVIWESEEDLLNGTITLENSADLPIGDFDLKLLKVAEPVDDLAKSGFGAFQRTNLGNLAAQSWRIGDTRLTFGVLGQNPPVNLRQSALASDPDGFEWILRITGGVHRMEDGGITMPLMGSARVEPGASLKIPFLLKSTASSVRLTTSEAVFRSHVYRNGIQPLEWPDRRPIGSVFVTKFGGATETNPKALFWDEDLDASNPEAVRASAIHFAEVAVEALEAINAQGAIVWDIEGTDLPIWFVGDPRMLPILNPEVDAVADELFQILTNAGFRVGVTIRPTQVYFHTGSNEWRHGTGSHGPDRNPLNESYDDIWPAGLPWWRFYPLVERLDRKIQYAKDRWGCTLFYIDTNGVFREMDNSGSFRFTLLDAGLLRELMDRHPDILLIPEFTKTDDSRTHLDYWGVTAPYSELDLGSKGTDDYIKTVFPDAFSIVNVSDGNIEANREALLQSVIDGDILMCRGWFQDTRNQIVKGIYDEAGISPDPPSP